ncbi:hypothetical protein [Paraburkholderia sp. GAS32]|uniref:hypothetical protein n=1 Tax=Paraburkholderia sp. GAS32 TaxID=3035129 RepID=UPI003D1ABD31
MPDTTTDYSERREYDTPATTANADRATFVLSSIMARSIVTLAKIAREHQLSLIEREFNSVRWTLDDESEVSREAAYLCVNADQFWFRSWDDDRHALASTPVSVAELKDTFVIE